MSLKSRSVFHENSNSSLYELSASQANEKNIELFKKGVKNTAKAMDWAKREERVLDEFKDLFPADIPSLTEDSTDWK